MANTNNPHGLRSLDVTRGGGVPVLESFKKVVGYGTTLFRGDAVNRVADGSIEAAATPGTTLYSGVNLNHGLLSTATVHTVVTSPDAIFEAQGDGSGSIDEADGGLNANLVLTAGNTSTKISKHQIAESTKQTTSTLDVKLHALLNVPDNAYGAYARWEITFNRHRNAPGVAGV